VRLDKVVLNALTLRELSLHGLPSPLNLDSLAYLVVPAYAVNASAHTITVTTDKQSYSCSGPIVVSGTTTGENPIRKPMRLTITNDETGAIVGFGKADVKQGAYSMTFTFTDTSMQGGFFTVTASWYGQVATTANPFSWA
jgi:hypothetical protein